MGSIDDIAACIEVAGQGRQQTPVEAVEGPQGVMAAMDQHLAMVRGAPRQRA